MSFKVAVAIIGAILRLPPPNIAGHSTLDLTMEIEETFNMAIEGCTDSIDLLMTGETEYEAALDAIFVEDIDENGACDNMVHLLQGAQVWVSPAPHGYGPGECLCDECIVIWSGTVEGAGKRQRVGICRDCSRPFHSIASWRKCKC